MAETILIAKDGMEFTVKAEFAKKVPNYNEVNLLDLFQSHGMAPFIHNPVGPAIRHPESGHEEYRMDGIMLDPETVEKIKHNTKFNKNFIDSLKDDTTETKAS